MSLTLTSNPVVDNDNLFAGSLPVVFSFKREDEVVDTIGSGANNNILITTTNDLSSLISVNDSIYLYNVGDNGHVHDLTATVLDVSAKEITIDSGFIELGSGGYINYKQNYYVEVDIVNPSNDDIKIIDFTLSDDGSPAGVINIDVSIINDLNEQNFTDTNELLTDSRTKFKVRYREVSDVETTAYTKIDDEIVLTYASEQFELEDFVYYLEEGKIYKGYEWGIIFAHTEALSEVDIEVFQISMNELDENQEVVNASVLLQEFSSNDSGMYYIKIPIDYAWNTATKYITFDVEFKDIAFFDGDFFSPFFET